MIDLLVLIAVSLLFAYVIQNRTRFYSSARLGIKDDMQSRVVYWGIVIAFILFAGLRSNYNDTITYIQGFQIIDINDINLSCLLESYGGFDLYQKVIKRYISDNPQVFIFITAIITNMLFLLFYTRHTDKFCEMLLMYAIDMYIFSMAGLKQAIAIAISLYVVENFLKQNYVKAIVLLLLAMSFHPYIICLLCIPFLKNKVWDIRTFCIIAVCIIAFMNLDVVFNLLSVIGKDYSGETFDDYTINPMRVVVEAVPVVLSFVYRDKINKSTNKMFVLGVNMRIISFAFISMGLFMNPIYFGRMSIYFSSLSAIAIPEMLSTAWKHNRNRRAYMLAYYLFFFVYFLMDMTKIGSISLTYDQFQHVPLSSLFQ